MKCLENAPKLLKCYEGEHASIAWLTIVNSLEASRLPSLLPLVSLWLVLSWLVHCKENEVCLHKSI